MLSKLAKIPVIHRTLIALSSAAVIVGMLLIPNDMNVQNTDPNALQVGRSYPVDINPELLVSPEPNRNAQIRWEKHTVKSGESSALLFKRIGLSARLLHNLISSDDEIKDQLSNLKPGNELRFGFNDQNELIQLIRPISSTEIFRITKAGDSYIPLHESKPVETQLNYAQATISSNFWNAAISAGLTPNQIMELAGMFGWDIDFALDIRAGDHFEVLFEERFVEGEYAGRGKIIAASFTNQGDNFKAIRNDKDESYYDQNGRAMKKAFLRSPINFRYVSSNFNPRRLHPVTGRVKAHRGTDYVAPVGTPIWAAGDGIVSKAGYNQFNGNYVFIRHSNTYITKYLHMKKRKVKTGQRVKQGQTVGTLGSTGRVTGAHLHYEFLVNGVHKNPRTVKLPQSKSLTGSAKSDFKVQAEKRLDQLERYSKYMATSSPMINH